MLIKVKLLCSCFSISRSKKRVKDTTCTEFNTNLLLLFEKVVKHYGTIWRNYIYETIYGICGGKKELEITLKSGHIEISITNTFSSQSEKNPISTKRKVQEELDVKEGNLESYRVIVCLHCC